MPKGIIVERCLDCPQRGDKYLCKPSKDKANFDAIVAGGVLDDCPLPDVKVVEAKDPDDDDEGA